MPMKRCPKCGEETYEKRDGGDGHEDVTEIGHSPDCPDWNKVIADGHEEA